MSVLEFYEMNEEPFSNAPVNRFFFNSEPHGRALSRLMYSIEAMKGLAVLIGEIGSGKTTLARRLLDSLSEDEFEAALLVIIHSGVDALWLLKRIAMQLGVEDPAEEKLQLLNQLFKRLVEIHEEGRKAVVLIDEAQMLCSKEIMEEFRGLLNLEIPERKLLNIVLIGLPDLEDCLRLDPPLAQRIAVKFRLGSLSSEMTEHYIKHRLRLAGAKRMLFTKEATEAIHEFSGGIPRLINTICDNALYEGHIMGAQVVDTPIVRNVCTDLGLGLAHTKAVRQFAGTRATDFATPTEDLVSEEELDQEAPPPPRSQGRRQEDRQPQRTRSVYEDEDLVPDAPPPPPRPASRPVAAKPPPPPAPTSHTPHMDEIDGILDSLIDKV